MKNHSQSVGRPREFDTANVLDEVMNLFWEQGFEGTALSDIVTATGLTKGSIYKAFQSKQNLYLLSLERYEELHVNSAVKALYSEADPMKRLDDFLSAPINGLTTGGRNKGCFLCNASADRADGDSETRALVKRGFEKMGQALTVTLSDLHPDLDPHHAQNFAQMLLAMYSGLQVMSRSGVSANKLSSAKSAILLTLKHETKF